MSLRFSPLILKLGISVALFMGSGSVSAASFNCASATTPREHLICTTPDLSADDDQMAQIYATALSALSEKGRDILRAGQRSWLRYFAALCPVSDSPDQAAKAAEVQCIGSNYNYRLRELGLSVQRKGPFLFMRVDRYEAVPIDSDSGEGVQIAKHQVSYPQIDQPVTPTTLRWNGMNVRSLPQSSCDSGQGDIVLNYTLNLATADLISVSWDDSYYCNGLAHGYDSFSAETLMLSPVPHLMRPGDLFQTNSDWEARLKNEIDKGLTQAANVGDYPEATIDRSSIGSIAIDPTRWSLTPEGLVILFQQYELGLGRGFDPSITIRWTDMQDLLQSNLHLPPKEGRD